ncbi:unannotated protein [freshwater metagenome]|uniref:Unannotated protein n=1 Tax=freshwater metagenome TaxID=449393 RepID=A0A6J7KQ99_9ZZZZ|nr:hypothetical protein [Actinomycetota bacterium]
MSQEAQRFFAVMDESISQNGEFLIYVISAAIFKEPRFAVEKVFREFLAQAQIFKTSYLADRKRFARIMSALKWNLKHAEMNISSWDSGNLLNQEMSRQFCLAKLLVTLQGQGVSRCIMDSRENPNAFDPQGPNKRDLHTLNYLREELLLSNRIELIHLRDDQLKLIGCADLISWVTRKHLLGEESSFWDVVSPKSLLI